MTRYTINANTATVANLLGLVADGIALPQSAAGFVWDHYATQDGTARLGRESRNGMKFLNIPTAHLARLVEAGVMVAA